MYNLNDLIFFVQAVDLGSFAAAGRRLGQPKSTVSKRVAELEAALGARLIHRTSRSFVLTDTGRDFYDHARAAVIEAEAAETVVRERMAEPSGTVRITASVPTAQFHLADQLHALARRFPKLEIHLHVTDRFVDLVQEGFDIAVRSHFAPLPDSDLMQRQIGTDRIVLIASPFYLEERGTPSTPEALSEHDGLIIASSARTWRLTSQDEISVAVAPRPRFFADESVVLLKSAIAGLGIACLPESIAAPAITEGALNIVLPSWTAGNIATTILTPHRRSQLPSIRAVIDFLAENRASK
ncbi:LysR family transcriptional regulator [Taklimakanibacter deserti]|uniref:LysR family transcriptional regulator n=1 Tax=Taklimakanibacter deserti TaxID=2267839 RepID=UPI000E6519B9